MSERIVHPHRRTGLAPSTPAARLIELQQEILRLQRELDVERAARLVAEERAERLHKILVPDLPDGQVHAEG